MRSDRGGEMGDNKSNSFIRKIYDEKTKKWLEFNNKTFDKIYTTLNNKTEEINKILIFPVGRYYVEKYKQWLSFDDVFFNKILLAFNSPTLPKPYLDIDHELGEAVGEIVDLEITNDGLMAHIMLNEEGIKKIKNREYRYVSPSFGEIINNEGVKFELYLDSVSLTNAPALLASIPKLQEQLNLNRRATMQKKFILSQITDDAVKNVVAELLEQGEKHEEIIASLEKEKNELLKKLEETQKEAEQAKTETEAIKQEQQSKEADEFIKSQVEMKKLNVKHSEFWKKQYCLNKDETIKYFNEIEAKGPCDIYRLSSKYELSNDDVAIMKSLKLNINDEKDVEFYKNNRG